MPADREHDRLDAQVPRDPQAVQARARVGLELGLAEPDRSRRLERMALTAVLPVELRPSAIVTDAGGGLQRPSPTAGAANATSEHEDAERRSAQELRHDSRSPKRARPARRQTPTARYSQTCDRRRSWAHCALTAIIGPRTLGRSRIAQQDRDAGRTPKPAGRSSRTSAPGATTSARTATPRDCKAGVTGSDLDVLKPRYSRVVTAIVQGEGGCLPSTSCARADLPADLRRRDVRLEVRRQAGLPREALVTGRAHRPRPAARRPAALARPTEAPPYPVCAVAKKAKTPRPPVQAPKRRDTRSGGGSWRGAALGVLVGRGSPLAAIVAASSSRTSGGGGGGSSGDGDVKAAMVAAGCTCARSSRSRRRTTANYHADSPTLDVEGEVEHVPAVGRRPLRRVGGLGLLPRAGQPASGRPQPRARRRRDLVGPEGAGLDGRPARGVLPARARTRCSARRSPGSANKIALTAWTGDPATYYRDGDYGMGHIAICPKFDEERVRGVPRRLPRQGAGGHPGVGNTARHRARAVELGSWVCRAARVTRRA